MNLENIFHSVYNRILGNESNERPTLSTIPMQVVTANEHNNFNNTRGVVKPLTNRKRKLPPWSSMYSNYPKDAIGGDMPADKVYEMVGGQVYKMYQSNPVSFANACALRISVALNKSGSNIPSVAGTYKGGDGGNYFLAAGKLNSWMTDYFGTPDLSFKSNFESSLAGNKGIYIMTPNYPGKFGASGHATLFDGTDCIGMHCYFNATGGVHQTNLWILK